MSHESNPSKALLDAWDVFLRYRGQFVLPACLVAALVLGASLMIPRKYKAEAIFERRTDMVLTEIITKGASRTFQNPRSALVQQLIGSPAIEAALRAIAAAQAEQGNELSPAELDRLRLEASQSLVVRYDINSNELDRIRLEFVGSDPLLAEQLVNTIVRNHIHEARAEMEARLRESATFFRHEVERSRAQIEDYENAQLSFEIEHSDLLPENPVNLQTTIGEAQRLLGETMQKRDAAALRVEALRSQFETTPRTIPSEVRARNPELTRMENRLRELREQLITNASQHRMTERHPDMIALRSRIESMEQEMAGLEREVVTQTQVAANPRYAELELMLASAAAEHVALNRQVREMQERYTALEAEANKLFPVRAEYRKLSREVQQAQRQLTFWEDNLRRVEMTLSAESGNRGVQFAFIKPCGPLKMPVSPNLVQVLMAAVVLGVAAGALRVFLAYRGDTTFRDAEPLGAALRLPVFGAVSELVTAQQRRMARLRRLVLNPVQGAALACVLLLLVSLTYLDLRQPAQFDALRSDPTGVILRQLGWQAQRDEQPATPTSDTDVNEWTPTPAPAIHRGDFPTSMDRLGLLHTE